MASQVPEKMIGITINGNKASIEQRSVPKVRPTYLLAKVDSIALNPTDWKHLAGKLAAPGGLSGCDFAGTIVEVGPDVKRSDLKPGDRIAATTHGGNKNNPEDGCFAEYALAKADLVVKIPDSLSFEKAATFPLGASTVAQGMFQTALKMKLPGDSEGGKGENVLIYGGSTATGTLAIEYAKLAGYRVLTTCSPRNNDLVKSFGADAVYDYNDPECAQKIRKDTNDNLKLAWDTVGGEQGPKICAEALSSDGKGCRYGTITGSKSPRGDIEQAGTIMYTIFNEDFDKFGHHFPASQADFEFAEKFFHMTEKLLHEGKLETHPEKVGEKGLEGALSGMKDMKDGKVSGNKLVYRVRDTPEGSSASIEL